MYLERPTAHCLLSSSNQGQGSGLEWGLWVSVWAYDCKFLNGAQEEQELGPKDEGQESKAPGSQG